MTIIRYLLLFSVIIITSAKVKQPMAKLHWLKLDEVSSNIKDQPKPVIIDIYTDWCHWCKVMDKNTYENQKVADYISEHFYASKINAETRDTLLWRGKMYTYNANYKIHDFALYATNWQASFPTTVIIPDTNADPIAIAGFMEPKEIEPILKYFGEGDYKNKTYEDFQKTFKSTW